jgi:hypothetical protein
LAGSKKFLMTPFGEVTWASTVRPSKPYSEKNDKGELNKDTYQLRLKLSDADLKAWQELVKETWGPAQFKTKNPKFGIARQESGEINVFANSIYKPNVFDMKNNKLEDPKIANGTIARMNVLLGINEKGISLRLKDIQVKRLVEWESSGGSSPFETGDGYEGEGSSPFAGGDTDDSSDGSDDADALGI